MDPWVGKIRWSRDRLPTAVFWPGEFRGLYSPWGGKESGRAEGRSLSVLFCILLGRARWYPAMIVRCFFTDGLRGYATSETVLRTSPVELQRLQESL